MGFRVWGLGLQGLEFREGLGLITGSFQGDIGTIQAYEENTDTPLKAALWEYSHSPKQTCVALLTAKRISINSDVLHYVRLSSRVHTQIKRNPSSDMLHSWIILKTLGEEFRPYRRSFLQNTP